MNDIEKSMVTAVWSCLLISFFAFVVISLIIV